MLVAIYGKPSRPEVSALGAGLVAIGHKVLYQRPTDWRTDQTLSGVGAVVMVGSRLYSGKIRDLYVAKGIPVLVMDLPALRGVGDYWALWAERVNNLPLDVVADRPHVPIEPPPELGPAVLVCGQTADDSAHYLSNDQLQGWYGWFHRQLSAEYPGREIVFRSHPKGQMRPQFYTAWDDGGDVTDSLASGRYGVVATFNSTAGITAIRLGYPVRSNKDCFYRGIEPSELMARCMSCQWTLDEIRTGRPLEITLERAQLQEAA